MVEYDPHEWWSHFFNVRGSMVRELAGRILGIALWATAVMLLHTHLGRYTDFPLSLHSVVGTALGLLLVFRTNSAYDRFWEGRKLWGGYVNESRNLSRAAGACLGGEPETVDAIRRWTVAFAYASMHQLRGNRSLEGARAWLPEGAIASAEAAEHVPLHCAERITDLLKNAQSREVLSTYEFVYLDQNVQLLVDYLGACERIRRTPLPFAYLVHLRRALLLYVLALPFALTTDYGWLSVPATALVAFVFFGIEEIGVEIEDPFGLDDNDLPLEDVCRTIEGSLLAGSSPKGV